MREAFPRPGSLRNSQRDVYRAVQDFAPVMPVPFKPRASMIAVSVLAAVPEERSASALLVEAADRDSTGAAPSKFRPESANCAAENGDEE